MRVYAGKVKAKSTISHADLNDMGMTHDNGWVTGWYADGMILGDITDVCEEYVTHAYWVPVDPDTLEADATSKEFREYLFKGHKAK